MSMLKLFHLGGRWLALDDTALVPLDEYPSIEAPVLVISDFEHALAGVMSFAANPGAAGPLIERRLRNEGMVDGECHIEIDKMVRIGKGFQALYTAVPMINWQRMSYWADAGKDHRLTVTFLTAAKRMLKPGQGMVLRHGKQVSFLAMDSEGIRYAETLAYSSVSDGILDSITALADRVRAAFAGDRMPDTVVWYGLDTAPGQDEAQFAGQFAKALDVPVDLAQHTTLKLPDGGTIQSALPALADAVHAGDARNQQMASLLARSEQALPLAAGVAAVLAAALLLFAPEPSQQAAELRAQAAELTSQSQTRLAALRTDAEPLRDNRAFIEMLAAASSHADMSRVLVKVRESARGLVRILRLRMDSDSGQVYVEGAIGHGPEGARKLGQFIANLRSNGFQPSPAVPPLGAQSADYFSYSLLPSAAVAIGGLP